MSLIPLTKEMRPVADRLYELGFEVMSASCFTYPEQQSIYEHRISLRVEFKNQYPIKTILGDLATGWKYYTQIVGTDWPISILGYCKVYVLTEYETVEERIKLIVAELAAYLDTRDKVALRSIMMLIG
jgi:hypothetical protein